MTAVIYNRKEAELAFLLHLKLIQGIQLPEGSLCLLCFTCYIKCSMFHVEMPESREISRKTKTQLVWIKTSIRISLAKNIELGGKMFLFIRKLNLYLQFTEKKLIVHNYAFIMNRIVGIGKQKKKHCYCFLTVYNLTIVFI